MTDRRIELTDKVRAVIPTSWAAVGLLAGSLALLALGTLGLTRAWRPRTYHLHMLTDLAPVRTLLARRIAEEARHQRLEIQLSARPHGALESLDLVDSPNPINLALVSAGVKARDYPNVRQVTALMVEPLHLFVRPELEGEGLAGLRGKRVNLGSPDSADYHLANDVLTFAGLPPPPREGRRGEFDALTIGTDELSRRLGAIEALSGEERARAVEELPDACFLLAPLPSITARQLVRVAGYRLVPLSFADAYCLDRLTPDVGSDDGDRVVRVDRSVISPTEVPAYTYSTDPPVPAAPCRTVATRLLLVCYAPTEVEAISRLLQTVSEGPLAALIQPPSLREQVPQFAFHKGAEIYQRRNDPLLTPQLAENLGKAAGGIGALVSGLLAFYGYLRVRRLRKFEAYYREVRQIELVAAGMERDPAAPLTPDAREAYLEFQLLDLKTRAVADFTGGGLQGEALLNGIVMLVQDARRTIERTCQVAKSRSSSPP
jgi:hypothetical protein